jgi:hypothetical protein
VGLSQSWADGSIFGWGPGVWVVAQWVNMDGLVGLAVYSLEVFISIKSALPYSYFPEYLQLSGESF